MNDESKIGILLVQFSLLSLLAFGGAGAVLPEMYRQTVDIHQWISAQEFSSMFALAQALPGPNVMVVTIIGWKVAGFVGALVATLAMCLPCSVLMFFVTHFWDQYAASDRKKVMMMGLSALTTGFIGASAYLMAASIDTSIKYLAITIATALITLRFKKLNPLWFIAGGAAFGFLFQ